MLPFLKPKPVAGLIVEHRKPDGSTPESHSEDNADHGLMACAEDLIRATHAKDAKGVADAFRAAFQILDSEDSEAPESDEAEDSE